MRHGTEWVEPGTGASLADLRRAIGQEPGEMDHLVATSLELTGLLIDEHDWTRVREVIACPEAYQSAHRVWREGRADGRWIARCTCGWEGPACLGLAAAKAHARDHVYAAPVRREVVA